MEDIVHLNSFHLLPAARMMKPVTWWKAMDKCTILPAGFVELMVALPLHLWREC